MSLPLQGVRVLDLSRILAGPYATMKLADMGAEVTKVEIPLTGDDTRKWGPPFANGEATYFIAVNRNKLSITLNLKHPRAAGVLERLIRRSDVLVENFRPGTLAELGFPWERIHALNPRIVYCAVSGYGQ
ncbi:MAG: CoA transferase, partial [Planctomycetota bacterium]